MQYFPNNSLPGNAIITAVAWPANGQSVTISDNKNNTYSNPVAINDGNENLKIYVAVNALGAVLSRTVASIFLH